MVEKFPTFSIRLSQNSPFVISLNLLQNATHNAALENQNLEENEISLNQININVPQLSTNNTNLGFNNQDDTSNYNTDNPDSSAGYISNTSSKKSATARQRRNQKKVNSNFYKKDQVDTTTFRGAFSRLDTRILIPLLCRKVTREELIENRTQMKQFASKWYDEVRQQKRQMLEYRPNEIGDSVYSYKEHLNHSSYNPSEFEIPSDIHEVSEIKYPHTPLHTITSASKNTTLSPDLDNTETTEIFKSHNPRQVLDENSNLELLNKTQTRHISSNAFSSQGVVKNSNLTSHSLNFHSSIEQNTQREQNRLDFDKESESWDDLEV